MDSDHRRETSKRVQLILSAKSSGSGGYTSWLANRPREKARLELREALEAAAQEVFAMMVGVPLGSGDHADLPRVADYTGMIGLAGDICGVLSFRCSNQSAVAIAGKMLDTGEQAPEECVRDALGEICNMVAGSFKARLPDLADRCMLSVPTVVSGKDYQLYSLANGERVQIAGTFKGVLLWFTLDLHS